MLTVFPKYKQEMDSKYRRNVLQFITKKANLKREEFWTVLSQDKHSKYQNLHLFRARLKD